MKCLVVGFGSIGKKHSTILNDLNCSVALVTKQTVDNYICYNSIESALNTNDQFEYIVLANPTHLHHEAIDKIIALDFQGIILVEKPLFSKSKYASNKKDNNIIVGYNLRFHELFKHVKYLLQEDELISFSVQAGSYLPEWRKSRDYRDYYSAKKEQGGGVLRDLSHELDYVLLFCGQCIKVTAMGGHYSTLDITSDDTYSILMQCEYCPIVNVQLDYLNKMPTRTVTMQTKNQNSIFLDLIGGDLIYNGKLLLHVNDAIKSSYIAQHESIIANKLDIFCTYQQGLSVLKLIEAIEQSAIEKKWITL
ncbi:MAG: gfo/Idh/MocA family oxidoreductase [Gammaproteobacteria bacterium]|nr:gfo/Idh/MocA family oxidoreductase [Gammaproteobacteria bacterium]